MESTGLWIDSGGRTAVVLVERLVDDFTAETSVRDGDLQSRHSTSIFQQIRNHTTLAKKN